MFGSGILGKLKPLIVGAAGGIAFNFGQGYNAQFGGPAAMAAVGFIGGNETLMTLSGIQLANTFTGATTTSAAGGWL
jgi:hypothetical protein